MVTNARRVAILGTGKIGESLLAGLLSGDGLSEDEIVVTARRRERAAELHERYRVPATLSNVEAVVGATLVVIAVKPQDFDALLGEIGPLLSAEQTVLSVAAAIPTSAIERRVAPGVPVIRAMPNAPATVHEASLPSAREHTPATSTCGSPRTRSRSWVRSSVCPSGTWMRSPPYPAPAPPTSLSWRRR